MVARSHMAAGPGQIGSAPHSGSRELDQNSKDGLEVEWMWGYGQTML